MVFFCFFLFFLCGHQFTQLEYITTELKRRMMALVDKSISSDFVSLVSILDVVLKNFKVQL